TNLRALLREVLAGAGYVVLEAGGAAEALAHCQRHPRTIHLLFGELGGAAEGWELAQQVREVRPEIQLLAITAFADRLAAAQTASRMGAYLLLKPFTPEAVLDRVREILGAPQSAAAKV
ncbi:MAG: response regulator, partial [Terriglobales bacterium]